MNAKMAELTAQLSAENEKVVTMTTEMANIKVSNHPTIYHYLIRVLDIILY